jgi:HSP20 family protein
MSFQDLILDGLTNLQNDGDLRGAFQHLINAGVDNGGLHPCVDIVDTPDNLYVYMELPGVPSDSIDVDFFNNKVTISGQKIKRYTSPPTKNEIVYGKFERTFTLPSSVTNQENVNVTYTNGILTLTIDKKKEAINRFRMSVVNSEISDTNQSYVDRVD